MLASVVFFCCVALCTATPTDKYEGKTYSGYQVMRAHAPSTGKMQKVVALARDVDGVELMAEPRVNGSVDLLSAPEVTEKVSSYLQRHGITYDVIVHDMQEAIDAENPPLDPDEQDWEHRGGHRLTWRRYHRYKDIESYIDYLSNTYPGICQTLVIGKSTEGRDLKVMKISTGGHNKPAIWIDGGLHAREWISPATVTYILLQLVEFREKHSRLLESVDWYIMPVANPDGYEFSHTKDRLWRKTRSLQGSSGLFWGRCSGVDPNRNWDFHWKETGSSSNPCDDNFAGVQPFSEPETKAMADFILQHKNDIKLYLTLHSYSQMWLIPWGWTKDKPEDYYDMYILAEKAVDALEKVHGTDYLLGTAGELLYTSSGGSDDWAKGVAGVKYAYTIELPDTGKHGFVLPASKIESTGQETWKAIQVLAEHFAK